MLVAIEGLQIVPQALSFMTTPLDNSSAERYEYHLTVRSTKPLSPEEMADLFDLSPSSVRVVTMKSSDTLDNAVADVEIINRRHLPVPEDANNSGVPNISSAMRQAGVARRVDIRPLDEPQDEDAFKHVTR